jgi:TRAP-type C4-dicarboxylate transport system permease small subunit
MKFLVDILAQAHKSLVFLEKALVILILFAMVALSFGQVVARNLFQAGWMWIDEALRLQVLWLTFLGAGLAAEYNRHVKIDVLTHILGDSRISKAVDTVAQLFAMSVCILLFAAAYKYVQVEAQYSTGTLALGLPDWFFRLCIPYFFFIMALRCLINIRRIFLGTHRRSIEP